jgi:hypothetical protein
LFLVLASIGVLAIALGGRAESPARADADTSTAIAATPGDVNCDGAVGTDDFLQVLRSFAGLSTSANCLEDAGDVDCSDGIAPGDGLRILLHVAEVATLPTEPADCGGATVTVSWAADFDIELFVLPQDAESMSGVTAQGLPGWDAALLFQCAEPSPRSASIPNVTTDAHYIAVTLAAPCSSGGSYEVPYTITIEYADGRTEVVNDELVWGGDDFASHGPYGFAP